MHNWKICNKLSQKHQKSVLLQGRGSFVLNNREKSLVKESSKEKKLTSISDKQINCVVKHVQDPKIILQNLWYSIWFKKCEVND